MAVTEIDDIYEYGLTPFWRTIIVIMGTLLVFFLFFVMWLIHITCFKHLENQESSISIHDKEVGKDMDADSKIADNNDEPTTHDEECIQEVDNDMNDDIKVKPIIDILRQYRSSYVFMEVEDDYPEKMDYVGLLDGKKLYHILSQSKIKVMTNTGVYVTKQKKIDNTTWRHNQTGEHHDISNQLKWETMNAVLRIFDYNRYGQDT